MPLPPFAFSDKILDLLHDGKTVASEMATGIVNRAALEVRSHAFEPTIYVVEFTFVSGISVLLPNAFLNIMSAELGIVEDGGVLQEATQAFVKYEYDSTAKQGDYFIRELTIV